LRVFDSIRYPGSGSAKLVRRSTTLPFRWRTYCRVIAVVVCPSCS
jgi:hypothetical protein